ncbi:hypothetical protein JQ604_15140 [Bradyrhizobium jicamae]|uniref:hypothetical protein n=1 Tax=Bradyrhizobium jicamae TaxID=280332 RepID=UPI001BAAE2F7|nr:hypothetical protein [Bradyrhizobium jicamae]MBR0753522.1 hypothetical protein [Bradyrhizobium jicamae]
MAIVNITCENDADFYRQFAYQFQDGTPIDLTGSAMRMGIRHRATDAHEDLLLTTENGGIAIVDATHGKFTVRITQAQLERLQLGDYEHSLIRMFSGMHLRVWSGSLINNAGASR